MEIIEMLSWIALGFVPMLGALEITSRTIRRIRTDTKVLRKEIIGVKRLLAYENGPHALRQLMLLREHGGHVTKYPEKLVDLSGKPYYFVEVTSNEGTRYIIEAYGKEAIGLNCEVKDRETEGKMGITA